MSVSKQNIKTRNQTYSLPDERASKQIRLPGRQLALTQMMAIDAVGVGGPDSTCILTRAVNRGSQYSMGQQLGALGQCPAAPRPDQW